MRPSEVTPAVAARFARLVNDDAEYEALPEADRREVELHLSAARGFVTGYTGLDLDTCPYEDVSAALLMVFAELTDNRQVTQQYTGQNPTVLAILSLHSTNLLPGGRA
jgi:hypothetical protein